MIIPRFKLLAGLVLMGIAAFLPTVPLQDILVSTTDTQIAGFDLSGAAVQFFVILVGAIGFSMLKDVVKEGTTRQKKKKSRYR
jgi:hypothetical protein